MAHVGRESDGASSLVQSSPGARLRADNLVVSKIIKLGDNYRMCRERAGLTRKDAAAKIQMLGYEHISNKKISDIEREHTHPSTLLKAYMSIAYKCTMNDFYEGLIEAVQQRIEQHSEDK